MRRGACPSLAAPMASGDGLIARMALPEGLSPGQLAGLAAAATRYGNGLVEVTARGSLQVRGLRPETAGGFADTLAGLRILPAEGPPVLTGPLAGLDPEEIADPRPLAAALRRFDGVLLPKVSAVVDGGGALHLDAVPADLRLRATPKGWVVAVGGAAAAARVIGRYPVAEDAVAAGLAVLARLSAAGVRARDLDIGPAAGLPMRDPACPVGRFALVDGIGRGVALAFGKVEATALAALAGAVEGAAAIRPAPGRAVIAVGLSDAADRRLVAAAERLGLVTDPGDARLRVVACAGAPACGAALLPTRAIAGRLAGRVALPAGARLHLSGCPKRCAQPAGPAVTLVGTPGGPMVTGEGTTVAAALGARLLEEARA
ncbi:hypothetical protein [Amaricoccus sp.]|uniref:hypothetical protein n=1 Tax=Amaricoccus sp. TaxID=1872485 RepID=UPI0025C5F1DF|nr:hypothetical protein [Amaricoccus sp.]